MRSATVDHAGSGQSELSARELAVTFTDTAGYFVSESSVYRLLKAHALITSPAFMVMQAAHAFKDKTTTINQLWQTALTGVRAAHHARRAVPGVSLG